MAKHQGPKDFAEVAFDVFQQAIGETPGDPTPGKNLHASALGRLGGLKGGKARASNMTPEERSEAARKAVQARWLKSKSSQPTTHEQGGD